MLKVCNYTKSYSSSKILPFILNASRLQSHLVSKQSVDQVEEIQHSRTFVKVICL